MVIWGMVYGIVLPTLQDLIGPFRVQQKSWNLNAEDWKTFEQHDGLCASCTLLRSPDSTNAPEWISVFYKSHET